MVKITQNNDDCYQCGVCCRNHTVLITFRDLREIHRYFPEINLLDIITIFTAPEDYIDKCELTEHYPKIKIKEESGVIEGYLGIKFKNISDPENPSTMIRVCPLQDDTHRVCTIHKHKPMVCRVYPHVIRMKKLSNGEEHEELLWENGRCPGSWIGSETSQMALRKRIKTAHYLHDKFHNEVEEWNRIYQSKTVQGFIEFILGNENKEDYLL